MKNTNHFNKAILSVALIFSCNSLVGLTSVALLTSLLSLSISAGALADDDCKVNTTLECPYTVDIYNYTADNLTFKLDSLSVKCMKMIDNHFSVPAYANGTPGKRTITLQGWYQKLCKRQHFTWGVLTPKQEVLGHIDITSHLIDGKWRLKGESSLKNSKATFKCNQGKDCTERFANGKVRQIDINNKSSQISNFG